MKSYLLDGPTFEVSLFIDDFMFEINCAFPMVDAFINFDKYSPPDNIHIAADYVIALHKVLALLPLIRDVFTPFTTDITDNKRLMQLREKLVRCLKLFESYDADEAAIEKIRTKILVLDEYRSSGMPLLKIPVVSHRRGYVYVMDTPNDGFKIGRTQNPPQRLRELQSEYGEDCVFNQFYLVNDMIKAEKDLHQMFTEKHIRRELFNLSEHDLKVIYQWGQINQLVDNHIWDWKVE